MSAYPRSFGARFWRGILRLLGWRLSLTDPGVKRYVLIVAPHTSNWDFPLGLLAAWGLKLNANWLGKHTLFRKPFGAMFRAFGGIPVNRKSSKALSQQLADRFAHSNHLVLAIAPEGTRSGSDHWKTGFWHIAREAQVPIAMAFIDYPSRSIGLGDSFMPSEDIDADFEIIRRFYAGISGKRSTLASKIQPRKKGN